MTKDNQINNENTEKSVINKETEIINESRTTDKKILQYKTEDYRKSWSKMTVDFTIGQPILAMCCSKAIEFNIDGKLLKIGFDYDANMLILNDSTNKKIILSEMLKNTDNDIEVEFYLKEKPIDKVADKVSRLKDLFDNEILKITKK